MGGDRTDEELTDADPETAGGRETQTPDDGDEPEARTTDDAHGTRESSTSDGADHDDERDGDHPSPATDDEAGLDHEDVSDDELLAASTEATENSTDVERRDELQEEDDGSYPADETEPEAEESPVDEFESLEDIDGIGDAKADALREAGYETVDDVRAATAGELTEVVGIGESLSERIKADVGEIELVEEEDDGDEDRDDDSTTAPDTSTEDDGSLLSGPQSDEEMPLTEHIEEMIKRLAIVIAIAGAVSLITFPFAERIINFLWYNIMPGVPGDIARPRLYGVLELVFTKLKVASLAGLIVALPVVVYETYQFMRPGLYAHERRYYLAAVPASLVLALVGVSFAYFIVLPAIFTYFLAYSQDVATIGFALGQTFNLILVLMGYLALVFQIPLFIMLAMMMGVVTRKWLAARRLLFWGAFLGISFIFSPDPTGMAPIIIALTMVGLFEGTLLLTKWAGRE